MASQPQVPSRITESARLALAQLAPAMPLDQVFARASRVAADTLDVERVGVWLFIDNNQALRCAKLYERSKDEYSSGAILRVADFPNYFSSLTLRKAVPAEIAATDPWTKELTDAYLAPLGISSLLDAGIYVESVLVGVVCHEHVGHPREWTTEARDFAGSVADLLALRIQAAEAGEVRSAFRTQNERLTALEKSIALEKMAASIAHDFKNVLHVLLSNGETLSMRRDLPRDVAQQCREIRESAQKGIDLVNELLAFASPAVGGPPTVMSVARAAGEILPTLRAAVGARHSIECDPVPEMGQILLDQTQFSRILLNLVVNAKDSMPAGGKIRVRIGPVKLAIDDAPPGPFILIEVGDQGVGMDAATLEHSMDPFFTTKSGGTGLGLAIVRRIAERAGGMVRIESGPGKGTVVRVFLPRVGAPSGGTIEFRIPPEWRAMGGAAGTRGNGSG